MAETKQPQRRQATQKAILEAAYALFSKKGFNNSTTKEIAELAGINELTIFRHFGNKYNLLSQVIYQYSSIEQLEQGLDSIKYCSFEEGFHNIASLLIFQLQQKYPIIRLMIIEATANPELKSVVGSLPVKLRQLLVQHLQRGVNEGKVRQDINLELAAQSFLWIFMSYVITKSDVGKKFCPFPSEEVAHASTEIFLRGLQPYTQKRIQ